MQKVPNNRLLIEVISYLFILLFIYASLSKILEFKKFEIQLGKSPLLAPFSDIVARIIPAVEIGVAILLALKRTQYFALYCSFSLMIIFSTYIVIILNFSEYIPCSCGGILQNMNWTQHLFFNLSFVLLSICGILIYPVDKNYCAVKEKPKTFKRVGIN